jgi:hypothetical protein
VVVLFLTWVIAGCGGDRSGGPAGRPEDVVGRAPDVTLSARTARIRINSPTAAASGVVDFAARSGRLKVAAPGLTKAVNVVISDGDGLPPALVGGDPFANVDLVRGTVHILSDGGAEVDGASTIRYTLTIDPQQAIEVTPPARQPEIRAVLQGRTAMFPMDVWIDSKLLIRRVEVPTDLKATTPVTRVDRLPIATDVDFLSFGVPA